MDNKTQQQEKQWFDELNTLDRMVHDLERVGWTHKAMFKILCNERDDLKRDILAYKEQQQRAEKVPSGNATMTGTSPADPMNDLSNNHHIDYCKDRLNARVIVEGDKPGIFRNFHYAECINSINGLVIEYPGGMHYVQNFNQVRLEEFADRLLAFLKAEKVDERFRLPIQEVARYVDAAIMIGAGVSLASEQHTHREIGAAHKAMMSTMPCKTGSGNGGDYGPQCQPINMKNSKADA